MNIFVKTKNVPNVLKCKINLNFFFTNMGFPNGGEGGEGSPTWEKFPHFPVFFFGERPLNVCAESEEGMYACIYSSYLLGGQTEGA